MCRKKQTFLSTHFLLTFASVLSAVGVHFFRLPNHFSIGGASGIGILLGALFPNISAGTFTAVLNLLLVVLGFTVLGKAFGWRSIYCSLLYSLLLELLELYLPVAEPLTSQKMLELMFAAILPAAGTAVLMSLDCSTGGTEVVAIILKKFTVLDAGKALLCVDILFTVATFFLFNLETGLYSCLGLFLKTLVIDAVLDELNRKKVMFIVTQFPEALLDYIVEDVHRSATFWSANGAYSNSERWVVMTVLNRTQAMHLRSFLRVADPSAFLLAENSSEIYGNGFLRS